VLPWTVAPGREWRQPKLLSARVARGRTSLRALLQCGSTAGGVSISERCRARRGHGHGQDGEPADDEEKDEEHVLARISRPCFPLEGSLQRLL